MNTVFDLHVVQRDPLVRAVAANPNVWTPNTFPWNSRESHKAEIPAANAIATARAMATLYAGLLELISPRVLKLGHTILERRRDPILDEPQAFGVGFEVQAETKLFRPQPWHSATPAPAGRSREPGPLTAWALLCNEPHA